MSDDAEAEYIATPEEQSGVKPPEYLFLANRGERAEARRAWALGWCFTAGIVPDPKWREMWRDIINGLETGEISDTGTSRARGPKLITTSKEPSL